MRAPALFITIIVFLAVMPSAGADVRDPGLVNKILKYGTFETPELEPGDQGIIAFDLTNPYAYDMTSVVLNVSIYQYVEQQVSIVVDNSWQYEYPKFLGAADGGREIILSYSALNVNSSTRIVLTVLTSTEMPHGGIFSQGSYLVRFWLTFELQGVPAKMASPGYWSKEQFLWATTDLTDCSPTDCVGDVNLTRLGGIQGILPDTAFGVKDRLPEWPFYIFAVGAVFFLVLAFLYYAEENPDKFPKTARTFAGFKGRVRSVFRPRKGPKT